MDNERRIGLTAFQLKVFAIITMLIDHIGAVLYPEVMAFRYVGRLSFPIFCFLLTEGFIHTRDIRKYMLRLMCFAVISEIPFDLAFHRTWMTLEKQNVFFTLLIGMGMIWLLDKEKETVNQIGVIILAMWLAEFLHTDYGFRGIFLIAVFWMLREKKELMYAAGAGWNFLWRTKIQYAGTVAMIPIALYNGQKGRNMKYFFYLFYPVHLLVLYMIFNWHCV